jgi:hypothetical protein
MKILAIVFRAGSPDSVLTVSSPTVVIMEVIESLKRAVVTI